MDFREMPHPAHTPELGFESVEDLDPSTVDRLAIVGPHIYTDGSKTEGKVGAALTEWRDEMESGNSTFRLESFCTVFQAEMFALHKAIKRVKKGKDRLVNIFSDSKSSLQMKCAYSVRAHAGTTGNERADELARNAALKKKTAADYDRYPLSYAKKVIRAASLGEWQQRYTEGGTGEITKCFFPRVEGAYRVLSRFTITPPIAQTLTGHGGFAQYLNRFKLKDSPYCACAPDKVQDVLHVLEECPIFGRERAETEAGTGVVVARHGFPALLDDERNRKIFLEFCERVTRRFLCATRRVFTSCTDVSKTRFFSRPVLKKNKKNPKIRGREVLVRDVRERCAIYQQKRALTTSSTPYPAHPYDFRFRGAPRKTGNLRPIEKNRCAEAENFLVARSGGNREKPETTWPRGPGSRSPRTTRDTSGDTGAEGEPKTVYRSPLRLVVPARGSKNLNQDKFVRARWRYVCAVFPSSHVARSRKNSGKPETAWPRGSRRRGLRGSGDGSN
ncbi:Putative 115 kDa protein in type-1 retrotransposable element R1DM [Eumeta japonica]|uniref:115 kDa protein in type-1 retrotransposable element R1DM n=1 Tax=Eumeta variegata TaxID=151549 RepID=A0A4C2AC93_EUMVA|nr:Putative 115 kDa protein in type-1 retrotransposable element R1DM [Eumeta japonica]